MNKNVIITILVIFVVVLSITGYLFYSEYNSTVIKNHCNMQIRSFFEIELTEFNSALLNTAISRVDSNVSFGEFQSRSEGKTLITGRDIMLAYTNIDPICVNYLILVHSAELETVTDKNICASKCGAPLERCYISMIDFPKIQNGHISQCVHLPTYTSFIDAAPNCEPIEGYVKVDPRNHILLGDYIFKSGNIDAGEIYPKICTYYKPFE